MKFHGTNSMTLSEDAIKVGHEVPGARLIVNQRLNQGVINRSKGAIVKKIDTIIRQGDVLLKSVAVLPSGCVPVQLDKGRIVLAYGEVTGHAHAIADHGQVARPIGPEAAAEIADAAIARFKAKLWQAPSGERFLEVTEPVTIRHEEHTAHTIQPGLYQVPTQVEYRPKELVRVAD